MTWSQDLPRKDGFQEGVRLPEAVREPFLRGRARSLRAGDALFVEGDVVEQVFFLDEGRIRLTKRVRSMTRTLTLLRGGALVGEGALAGELRRQATATALTDAVVFPFDPDEFRQLLLTYPVLASGFFEQIARRVRAAEDQIELMMLADPPSKVVGALLKLARDALGPDHPSHRLTEPRRGSSSPSDPRTSDASVLPVAVTLAVSPVDLSSRIGLEIDAVKRAVLRLREQDYLRVQGDAIQILDVDALERLFALLGSREDLRAEGVTR